MIPNIEAVAPVEEIAGVGALGQNMLSEDHRDLDPLAFIDFLYARDKVTIPDPKNPLKTITLPAKGPAICFSSLDFGRLKTALQQLCVKAKCSYEQKQSIDQAVQRMETLEKGIRNDKK